MADFYGLPTRVLENKHLRLEYLAEAGPRLVRLFVHGSQDNLLIEVPDIAWDTPHGLYHVWGGHRLWHSPEVPERTYVPDDSGLVITEIESGVRLEQPTEAPTGIRKSIEVILHPDRPALTLHHFLKNEGLWEVQLAAWAITQLPLGGVAVHPQPVGPISSNHFLANRQIVLWPYTRWQDPRLVLEDDLILIRAEAQLPPVKIGYMNRQGWMGYLRNELFMLKRFQPQPELPHLDFGCNAECYCNHQFIEVETLSPRLSLEPGQQVMHAETWEIYPAAGVTPDLDGVRPFLKSIQL